MSRNFAQILENRAFLYFCFLISTFALIFFAKVGSAGATAVFLFSGYFVSFFTKKMAIVLLISLVLSYIYLYGIRFMTSYTEGFSPDLEGDLSELMQNEKVVAFLKNGKVQKKAIEIISSVQKNINSFFESDQDIQKQYLDIMGDETILNLIKKIISDIIPPPESTR